ncbi:hypothetical protein ACFL3V_03095 [Nanoarchaeota archaeon]
MLIVDAVLRTTKEEDEQVVVRAHRLKRDRRINTAGLEEIIARPYVKHPITGKFGPITTFSISRPMTKPDAIEQLELLQTKHPGLRFTILDPNYFFLLVEGANKYLRELPATFTRGVSPRLSGRSWVRRMLNMPFSTVQLSDTEGQSGLYIGERLSLKDFLKLKTYAFDTEFMHWEKDRQNRAIVLGSLRNSEEQIRRFLSDAGCETHLEELDKPALVTLVEEHFNEHTGKRYPKQPMTIQVGQLKENRFVIDYFEHLSGKEQRTDFEPPSGMPTTLFNHKTDDAQGMMAQFQQFLAEHPFLVMISQNGMNYDLRELAEYAEREERVERFNIADYTPSKGQGPGFFKKVIIPSIFHLDLAPYSQNYFPFTIDNRFETITSLVLGKSIKKSQGYEDLTRLTIEQLIGSEQAADELRDYGIEDVLRLNQVEGYFKTMVYLKSLLFLRSPEDVCVTSRRQLAKELYEFRGACRNLTPIAWSRERGMTYSNMDPAEVFFDILDKRTKKALKKKARKGFSKAGLYYIAPFTNIFWKELFKSERARPMLNHFKKLKVDQDQSSTKETLMRFDIMYTLEEGYNLPYILNASENGFKDKEGNIKDDNVRAFTEKFSELVRNFRPMNRAGNFYCFPTGVINTQSFHDAIKHVGYKVAEGELLNIDNGSFALNDGVSLYVRRADLKGRFGYSTLYEKELIQDMIRLAFDQGPDAAVKHVTDFIQRLRNREVDRSKLIDFKESLTRDYLDWSSYSQRFSRIQAYIELGLTEGDKFAHVRLPDGWHPLEEFLEMSDEKVFSKRNMNYMLSRYLGKRDDKGKRTFKGRIGRMLRPLIQHYDMDEQEAVQCIEEGRYDDLFQGQTTLFSRF